MLDGPPHAHIPCDSHTHNKPTPTHTLTLTLTHTLTHTQQVLICGFSNRCFMRTLLQQLDSGPHALVPGSSITLFNQHNGHEVAGVYWWGELVVCNGGVLVVCMWCIGVYMYVKDVKPTNTHKHPHPSIPTPIHAHPKTHKHTQPPPPPHTHSIRRRSSPRKHSNPTRQRQPTE